MEVLAKHSVLATFFMIGKFVRERPDVAQEVSRAGHSIGNHTVTHPALPDLTENEIAKEIDVCENILTEVVGPHSNMFRPPFFLTSPAIEDLITARGLTTIMCKASGGDATPMGVDFIVEKVHNELNAESGIILLHDGWHRQMGGPRADSVTATDRILTRYKNEGCEFVSPLELT